MKDAKVHGIFISFYRENADKNKHNPSSSVGATCL
jgi:hypothetical protein